MYHIERALKKLRTMVHNKSKVEGCITEEFKLKEIMYFSSVYFAEHHNGREYHTRTSFLFIFLLFFNWCSIFIHPTPVTQWNELDGTPRGSSGHSNQPHHDGDPDDVAWFLLFLSCCKLFDVMNYYLMSAILMFIMWIYAWDGSNFCFKNKIKIDNFRRSDHNRQKLLNGNFRRLTIADESYFSNFRSLMVWLTEVTGLTSVG
jgi:hypothetical protein